MSLSIGVDFGTQSCRALVVEMQSGRELGVAQCGYAYGVLTKALPDGAVLPGEGWALMDPGDYAHALEACIRGALKEAGARGDAVAGLALSATASTLLPLGADGTPLCKEPAFASRPHAWLKLWKHGRAQSYASLLTGAAARTDEDALKDCGGSLSGEWALPKMLETKCEDPEVFRAADRFMEVSDWLQTSLTGSLDIRNASIAAYKALYSAETGAPSDAFFTLSGLGPEARHKLRGRPCRAGDRAGFLTREAARRLSLTAGCAVGMAHIDSHCAALGAGVCQSGDMSLVLGTSSASYLLSDQKRPVRGLLGGVQNGMFPGLCSYTAGQSCVGDMLEWFRATCMPGPDAQTFKKLEEGAAVRGPRADGMVALDWWNGNRCKWNNAALRGVMTGLGLDTAPEDIYRALLESVAFGQKMIFDTYLDAGLSIDRVLVCGGVAQKCRLLLQVHADVLSRELARPATVNATALGAAICAAAAAGPEKGGYASLREAARGMRSPVLEILRPDPEKKAVYRALYKKYELLYHFFGGEHPALSCAGEQDETISS